MIFEKFEETRMESPNRIISEELTISNSMKPAIDIFKVIVKHDRANYDKKAYIKIHFSKFH